MAELPTCSLQDALKDVPSEKLDRVCTSDALNLISLSFTCWAEVSPWLGLTEADEEDIRARSDQVVAGLQRERINVLRKWQEKNKNKATYRCLVEAFFNARRLDLVDCVIDLLQMPTILRSTPSLSQRCSAQSLPHSSPRVSWSHSFPPVSLLQPPESLFRPPLAASPRYHALPPPCQAPPLAPPSCALPPSHFHSYSHAPPAQAQHFPLTEYGKFLKEVYSYQPSVPTSTVQWPPVPIKKIFNLAMIKKKRIQQGEILDEDVRPTVTGKVDDILDSKTPVKLEDIFGIDQDNRKVILFEGAPGSGKSTMSWDMCKRWGAGELFQEYEVVILVQLRDPKVHAASTLADILPAENRAMAESVAREIEACKGQKVLFLLDGWDELPSSLRSKSLLCTIIAPELGSGLHKSAVIVTSRPISSGELHPLVSSRVEIIGFTPEELRQYFTECLGNDSRAVQKLLDRVEENPVVASSCYLPLNAAIIVHLFLSGNETLPSTTHGIFTSLVLCCLSRYQRERLGLQGEAANLESLNTLPKHLRKPFKQLCALAFLGVMKDRVTFSSADLKHLSILSDVSALGLLQAVPSIVSGFKVSVYYNFLHLQVQELLAAYHISSLPASQQISHFQKLFNQPRFTAVFQFYAGITQLRSERKFLGKVSFILPAQLIGSTGVHDIITNMIQFEGRHLLVSVINCLYEANDSTLCHFVASQLKLGLSLWSTTLSPLDCLS